MSIEAMMAVLNAAARLTPSERVLLIALGSFADKGGRQCWPSHRTLAKMSGLSVRSVCSVVGRLTLRGLLRVEERATGTRSTRYYIDLSALARGECPSPLSGEAASPLAGEEPSLRSVTDEAASPVTASTPDGLGVKPVPLGMKPATPSGEARSPDPLDSSPIHEDQDQRARARDSQKVLVRIAHEVLDDEDAERLPRGTAKDELKSRAARAHIAYDSGAVTRALDSAEIQRRRRA